MIKPIKKSLNTFFYNIVMSENLKKAINPLIYKMSRPVLLKNEKYRDIHKGESCYIFGNGSSIKYFDLEQFSDRISIGCGLLFLHKDFDKINAQYYYTGHPFFYYPIWINPYSLEFEKNTLGPIYKSNIYNNRDVHFFASLTNYFGLNGDNVNFVYHFNEPFNERNGWDLSSKFSFSEGSLTSMIAMALYMGFEDITLVGCDYTTSPTLWGHFYEYGKRPSRENEIIYAKDAINAASRISKIQSIVIDKQFKGDIVDVIDYKDHTNMDIEYKENHEILDHSVLTKLSNTNMGYNIFPEK